MPKPPSFFKILISKLFRRAIYEAVLKQEPTNRQAWRGLDKIQARYRVLINKALKRGQQNRVRVYQSRIALVADVKKTINVKYVAIHGKVDPQRKSKDCEIL